MKTEFLDVVAYFILLLSICYVFYLLLSLNVSDTLSFVVGMIFTAAFVRLNTENEGGLQ